MSAQSDTQNVKVGVEQGGDRGFVKSGGELDIEDGGALKLAGVAISATAAEINRVADASGRIVSATADLALTQALHDGKTVVANKADGIAFTLPAATGSGTRHRIVVGTAISSNNLTVVVTGDDVFTGHALFDDGDGEPANGWPTAADSNRITMGGTTNASGGTKGDIIELEDIAADTWSVRITGVQGGAEVTPFSHV